jgi:hypothetical protein
MVRPRPVPRWCSCHRPVVRPQRLPGVLGRSVGAWQLLGFRVGARSAFVAFSPNLPSISPGENHEALIASFPVTDERRAARRSPDASNAVTALSASRAQRFAAFALPDRSAPAFTARHLLRNYRSGWSCNVGRTCDRLYWPGRPSQQALFRRRFSHVSAISWRSAARRAQKICGYLVHARVSLELSTIELLRARRHLADGQSIERGDLTPGRSRDAPGFQRRDD